MYYSITIVFLYGVVERLAGVQTLSVSEVCEFLESAPSNLMREEEL
jgi:hypothetical protein